MRKYGPVIHPFTCWPVSRRVSLAVERRHQEEKCQTRQTPTTTRLSSPTTTWNSPQISIQRNSRMFASGSKHRRSPVHPQQMSRASFCLSTTVNGLPLKVWHRVRISSQKARDNGAKRPNPNSRKCPAPVRTRKKRKGQRVLNKARRSLSISRSSRIKRTTAAMIPHRLLSSLPKSHIRKNRSSLVLYLPKLITLRIALPFRTPCRS